jgi:1-deoxy-D-xylulose-5-phosphate reductoisomerase
MPPEKIRVVIHPQSVVHAMIRLCNGSFYAHISKPDMRGPIHDALYWPEIRGADFGVPDFDSLCLEFKKPDFRKFPMLGLAYDAAKQGRLYPCVYNGANEAAVAAFFQKRIGFLDIPVVTRHVLEMDWPGDCDCVQSVLNADKAAREAAENIIKGNF